MDFIDKRTISKYDFGSPKEDLNGYMRKYMAMEMKCDCGCKVRRSSLQRHMKSNKHKFIMEILNKTN